MPEDDLTDDELKRAAGMLKPKRNDERCAQLWACYQSGQMSAAQWQGHLSEEPGLSDWLRERVMATGSAGGQL